jgi:hypothetical protein
MTRAASFQPRMRQEHALQVDGTIGKNLGHWTTATNIALAENYCMGNVWRLAGYYWDVYNIQVQQHAASDTRWIAHTIWLLLGG